MLLVAWYRRPAAIRARVLALLVLVSAATVSWCGYGAMGALGGALVFAGALTFALVATVRRRDILLLFSPRPEATLRVVMRRLAIDHEEDGAQWLLPKYGGRLRIFTFLPNCYWVSLSAERITPKVELLTTLMRKFLANPDSSANHEHRG